MPFYVFLGRGGMISTPAELLQGFAKSNQFVLGGWGGDDKHTRSTELQPGQFSAALQAAVNMRFPKTTPGGSLPPFLPQNKQSFPKHTPNFALGQRGQTPGSASCYESAWTRGADSSGPSVQERSARWSRCSAWHAAALSAFVSD